MKKLLLSSLFLFFFVGLFAQSLDLASFNQRRVDKTKTAMLVLGTWAIGNIAVGAIGQAQATGSDRRFHQMNALWNGVNLVIAGAGYYAATRTDAAALGLFDSVQEQYKVQKVLLFNAGLDIGYILGGAYLRERGKTLTDLTKAEKFRGWGKSIMLQGGFLFVFDLVTYGVLASANETLRGFLSAVQFSGSGVGLAVSF